MQKSDPPVVLASSSAYRQQLLSRLLEDFDCFSPAVDERPQNGEKPPALAARLAKTKAEAGAARYPHALVIGSDQVAALGDEALGKPGTHERAVRQLRRCAGQTVLFHTAVAVTGPGSEPVRAHLDCTIVRFRELAGQDIENYLQADRPYDCAGSFKVESRGVMLFDAIESSDPTALQGLPLIWLAAQLRLAGVI